MATGKELVRLTECGYWKRLIAPDVDEVYFYNEEGDYISVEACRSQHFCSMRIKLKDKVFSEKYVTLLAEFCRLIASTNSETMFVKVIKGKYYFIFIN